MIKQGYTELTLDLLQKSPEAGHLLVQLHDKHKLYSLAKKQEPEARVELAAIMSDLLSIGLSQAENELVTDVLMSLMRQAETDLKQAVAERISTMNEVPLRLVVHLANDDISIANPILRFSTALEDTDLVYIIRSQTEEHWRAIATRSKMSDQLIDTLADTKDLGTAINLSKNTKVKLTGHAIGVLSNIAETSDALAKPLLRREELPDKLATTLYSFVGRELKQYIKENFDVSSIEVETAIDDIVFEMAEAEEGNYAPSESMVKAAESMKEKGLLHPTAMVSSLRRGQISNFIAMYSIYCEISVDIATDMLEQNAAQGLAIACKATGIMKSEFVNIFLLTSRMRDGRVIDQKDLAKALAYYDRISVEVAEKILSQSRSQS